MKIGDQKQAAILGIVAILAVGFLFMQLKGHASGAAPAVNVAANTPAPADQGHFETVALLIDPFSNPALIKDEKDGKQEKPQDSKPNRGPWKSHLGDGDASDETGHDPVLPDAGIPYLPGTKISVEAPDSDTKEKDATKPDKKADPVIVLNAVVSAGSPVALITVDGQSHAFKPGQMVVPGVTMASISANHVVLNVRGHDGPVTLSVGSKL